MAKYRIIKEFSYIPPGIAGQDFSMNTPPPIILKVGQVIDASLCVVPATNTKALIYTYTKPPQPIKSFYVPMENVVKDDSDEVKSDVKLSLTDKFKILNTTKKTGIILLGVLVLAGISLGILELSKKIKK